METQEAIENGRKYKVLMSPDMPAGAYIIVGPPEGLVDRLGYPEPFATSVHNILYDRGIFTARDASRNNVLLGVLQEALLTDAQRLFEEFSKYEQETV